MKLNIHFLVVFLFIGSCSSFAQAPNNAYTIKQGDWLMQISKKVYGTPQLYYHIIEGTNQKAASDNSFTKISNASDIKVGQKIWIPRLIIANNLTEIPKTDCEIRIWYNYQIVAIGVINEKWKQDGLDLKTRSQKAYQIRHDARVNARFMMQDKTAVKTLQDRDQQKYGNPDGPTFEYLLKKNTDKGLSLEAAYQAIINSSSQANNKYNADCL